MSGKIPKIALSMIIRQEEHLGVRPYENLLGNFDVAIILDTGSTDNTKEIAKNFMSEHKIPGEVYSGTWAGFDGSRTEAIELAERWIQNNDPKSVYYLLFMDADDLLENGTPSRPVKGKHKIDRSKLTCDQYSIDMVSGSIVYDHTIMIKINPL